MCKDWAGPEDLREIRPCPALLTLEKMLLTTRSKQVQQIFREREKLLDVQRDDTRRISNPHNPLHEVLADGSWEGQPCFIIGGGPSLLGFDFERLRGKGRVIAINRALEFAPFADVVFFMDWKLYKRYHDNAAQKALWDKATGIKVFLNLMGRKVDDVRSVRSRGRTGISGSLSKGLYHGSNSGFGALNLALVLRASPIYLLGYDMKQKPGRSHFHSGYGSRGHGGVCSVFLKPFYALEDNFKAMRHVVNLSPDSALKIFRFGNIEEVLNGHHRESVGNDVVPVSEPVLLSPSPAS